MAYGTVKVDNITFTNAGVDQTITVSGIVQSISGDITATGTIQAQTIIGTSTVSGATVTGTAGVFTTVTGGSAGFTTVTGTTVTGTTANFITLSGTTVTGTTANFITLSGTTVTGNVGQFTTLTGGTVTLTSGVFASGTAAAPSVSVGTTNNGLYSPGTNELAISTAGTGRLFVNSSGQIGIGAAPSLSSTYRLEIDTSPGLHTYTRIRSGGTAYDAANIFFDGTNSTVCGLLPASGGSTGGFAVINSGANPITFSTNSTERLRITSTGNVGIGTSSPAKTLDVVGQARISSVLTMGSYIQGTTQLDLYGDSSSSSGIRLDSSGRLLVGTTTASGANLLQVNSDALIYGVTVGRGSGAVATNVAVGGEALNANTTGSDNSAVGYRALYSNTTGVSNTAYGYSSLRLTTTGSNNTATGYAALYSNTTAGNNVATGYYALHLNTTGANNTATGSYALFSNTTGDNNIANGSYALFSNTTGTSNAATGHRALYSNTTGTNNAATGYYALFSNTTGNYNTANGYQALNSNTTGNNNVANGYVALYYNTTGTDNVATGQRALRSNTTGNKNIATGSEALYANTTGVNNTANGFRALYSNTTGVNNTATGSESLYSNTTGYDNVASGYQSLYSNTTGVQNTATGTIALYYNTTGGNNTANGYGALHSNTTGGSNTATGYYALFSNTTGIDNVANGFEALYYNTTGPNNVAAGYRALYSNTTGTNNAATGYYALFSNTTGTDNVAIGSIALYSNTTGSSNTATGYYALYANTTGSSNIAIGTNAGNALTTGSNNVIIGGIAGTAGLADTMIFGTGNGTERFRVDSSGRLGIRTSNPLFDLDVYSSGQATAGVRSGTTNASILFQTLATGYGTGNGFYIGVAGGSNYIWTYENEPILFATNNTERLRITSDGKVGLGTSSPHSRFHVDATKNTTAAKITTSGSLFSSDYTQLGFGAAADSSSDSTAIRNVFTNPLTNLQSDLAFLTHTGSSLTEKARIDSSGRLLVGTSTARSNVDTPGGNSTPFVQIETTAGSYSNGLSIINNSTGTYAPILTLGATNGSSVGSNTIVTNGQYLGTINFVGADGTNLIEGASIRGEVDGAPGANDMPGRLVFSTTADGASSPTERMRITSAGVLQVADAGNIAVGTTTGTKIGTATSQKIGFFDATPVVQPTTGVAEAAFVENSGGTAVNVDSTFGGYTLQQVVQALQNLGILA